jgi:arylformamidase
MLGFLLGFLWYHTDMTYIDLTMPLNPQTPVYPGDPAVEVGVAAELDKDGYLDHTLQLGTHNGTHIDAPAHMVARGKMLNEFPVDCFVGPGKVVDVRNGIDPDLLEAADVQVDDIVFFYTGFSERCDAPDYYEAEPLIPEEAVEFLIDRNIKMFGIDAGSVDGEPFPVHKALLSKDILIIENLVNLRSLVGKRFNVTALPLNVDVEGCPARVIAEIV